MVENIAISVRFAGKLRRLNPIDKRGIKEDISGLVGKYRRVLRAGALKLNIRQNSEKLKKVPLFLCKVRFWGRGKSIAAHGSEYGINQTVDKALRRVEHRLIRDKERGLRF